MTTIENRRFALLMAGGVVLFLLYQAWQKDYPAKPAAPAAAQAPLSAPADEAQGDALPPIGAPGAATATATGDDAGPSAAAPATEPARIRVRTDRFIVDVSTQGGDLRRIELSGYPVTKKEPDRDMALLDDTGERWFVIQSGLAGREQPIASHKERYRAAAAEYALADGADTLEVPLEYSGPNGEAVTKTYRFTRGSYVIGLTHHVKNATAAPLTASPYVQLWRTPFEAGDEPPFTATFKGIGLYEQKEGSTSYRFRKVAFDDLAEERFELTQTGGWLAMMQHYFFAAVLPPADEAATFVARPSATRGWLAQYVGAPREVPAGGAATFGVRLYAGPKLQQSLAAVAPGLELTVDYGLLTPLAEPLFWLLDWFHRLTRNWGVAIILLTLSVRLALYKLSESQYRSMAKMKKYAPRIQEIKERYGDDRERMNKAMMELYKKEKFNPLAGCWPLLVQFPVFIALYWVLLESVELRQADFALWLSDLSAPDPFYVLPVLYGLSMWAQQKLSGTVAMDPMQQRVMNMMPVMLTVFFVFFPAGLVLYWCVSNLIGIGQQWFIVRRLEREGLKR